MPKAKKDKFAPLSADLRRQVLEAHRQAVLADLFSAELHLERVVPGSPAEADTKGYIERLEKAATQAEERLAALDE